MFLELCARFLRSPRTSMKWKMSAKPAAIGVCLLLLCGFSAAQTQPESKPEKKPDIFHRNIHFNTKRFNFDVGGGITNYVGDISSRVHTGWNGQIGAGLNLSKHVGFNVEYMYNTFDVSPSQPQMLNLPDGDGWVHSVTFNPFVRFPIKGRLGAYMIGGFGRYSRTVEFNQPTTGVVNITDPWWGYKGSAQFVRGQVIGSVSNSAFGGNVGSGLTFKIKHGSLFAEARYHTAGNSRRATQMLPFTAGIRF